MARHYKKLIINEKRRHEYDIINALQNKMDEQYTKTQNQMDECYTRLFNTIEEYDKKSAEEDKKIYNELGTLKNGMLSIQGIAFKEECNKLLHQNAPITYEQFNRISNEHRVYKSLGGNHDGDLLFEMVEVKYKQNLGTETM